jgi:hypothetical protein
MECIECFFAKPTFNNRVNPQSQVKFQLSIPNVSQNLDVSTSIITNIQAATAELLLTDIQTYEILSFLFRMQEKSSEAMNRMFWGSAVSNM